MAAATFVEADLTTGRSRSGFTGVLAEHRGRGLAKLIKSASLRRVAAAGITGAYTSNDAANAPMLAVLPAGSTVSARTGRVSAAGANVRTRACRAVPFPSGAHRLCRSAR